MSKQQPHKARKRFGQNFLHDHGVIRHIVASIAPKKGQRLVEIGPGKGALTEGIISITERMDVVELDRDLIPILKVNLFRFPELTVHEADAMKFDFTSLRTEEQAIRVVGNLPYNISTPLIFHLLSQVSAIQDMHFMLQKEVVDRLAARPGDSLYGRLSVMAQYYCSVESLFIVGPESFDPAPKVDSAIVRMTPHKTLPHPVDDIKKLEDMVRTGFQQRRKTLRNNYKGVLDNDDFAALNIDPTLRPERLDVEDFVRITNYVLKKEG
ncbi:16S rRNA (adenine(1518)-N(6)/adenine(1519)-N(6))-dimethyltransferase [Marinomonas primoryensis]|jgi:16S rRNA (adenine1518-N6/adenine1519-N6)-dimethyltransferase|uniref:Ribosomal RNA small subunit methyltransferase A n=1 Tax=Marinomonas primoryensis TaxID=178399 RepID=A0A2Z4PRY2_9GAMM|nr:16S rRNA (adenine(1518)-N(6)/adenine(1519)-N(6))-dimethyltransferase RsmA [Marinomonas primoryensis]AWX99813.1 16S rRNA (adenine(1518)-N(6)/adenine(1519)-N(6))-dimethyltransferase [Marinomonas primoryensis]QKK79468.1 SSU rRNA (adenine(1518)-N(6)/adenine(1519)-N(6))-dimethyltransferase [Marinomonas primoryensis]|tara:strand:+ start:33605 stop:34405 length:801 start_codon:yes stop_codon:yes gene_type:complete